MYAILILPIDNKMPSVMYNRLCKFFLYHIRQYFGFSRHETYGTLFLLLIITLALLLPYFLHGYDLYHHGDFGVQPDTAQ